MLGNAFEWCQDNIIASQTLKAAIISDVVIKSTSLDEKNRRVLRGGTFFSQPASVRSALRIRFAPAYRLTDYGFRPSRTCP
jgi:formylglycine-generating enzyme required for sulfatase activity